MLRAISQICEINTDEMSFARKSCSKLWDYEIISELKREKAEETDEDYEEIPDENLVLRLKDIISYNYNKLYEHLVNCHAEMNTGKLMSSLIKQNKDYEAAEIKRLWGCLIDVLECINDTLSEREISFSDFSRLIRSMVGRIKYSIPPQTLDSVTAASARNARLDSPRVVFVMGANDKDFPNQVSVRGLFSESDRSKLEENGIV